MIVITRLVIIVWLNLMKADKKTNFFNQIQIQHYRLSHMCDFWLLLTLTVMNKKLQKMQQKNAVCSSI